MNPEIFEIMIAVLMVAVSVIVVMWIREYMATASERRTMRMLMSVGLDPEIATRRDTEAIMKEVRRRCQKCYKEGLCEKWLAGEVKGDNSFCPNARVFDHLQKTTVKSL